MFSPYRAVVNTLLMAIEPCGATVTSDIAAKHWLKAYSSLVVSPVNAAGMVVNPFVAVVKRSSLSSCEVTFRSVANEKYLRSSLLQAMLYRVAVKVG